MSAKKKEVLRGLGGEYFEEERKLLDKGYESIPIKSNWLLFACIPVCLVAFWALKRLFDSFDPDGYYSVPLAIYLVLILLGMSLYYVVMYIILVKFMNVPKDKICLKRRFLRAECYCRYILPKRDYMTAKIVPLTIFVIIPAVGEVINPSGWFLAYASIMLVCLMVEVYYCIQMGLVNDDDCMVGIVPGSADIRIYRQKENKTGYRR